MGSAAVGANVKEPAHGTVATGVVEIVTQHARTYEHEISSALVVALGGYWMRGGANRSSPSLRTGNVQDNRGFDHIAATRSGTTHRGRDAFFPVR